MQDEIEAKFLSVDHAYIRKKLQKTGAHLEQPMRLMKRVILDRPDGALHAKHAWLRVRDEGDKVTMTLKQDNQKAFGSAKETEVVVDNYAAAVALLCGIGFEVASEQESKRETWHIGDVEVVLDVWPWINPFIEIEGPTKQSVKDVAAALELDWDTAIFGSVTNVYRAEYPAIDPKYSIGTIDKIAFNIPPPSWFGEKKS